MIDHIGIRALDFPRLVTFYREALAPIGYGVQMEFPGVAGLGEKGKPDFWLSGSEQPTSPVHVSFTCTRPQVDAFHAAALNAGGTDNGPPGLRADYHPHYYAAFILDPEGNNVEAVCHAPPGETMKSAAGPKTAKKPPKKPAKKPAAKAVAKKPAKRAAGAAKKPKAAAAKRKGAAKKRR